MSSEQATLLVVDREAYDQFVAKQRGKVVLVDFWATWCPTCQEGFPDTVRLAGTYRNRGLVVASLAIDEPDAEATALEFLRSQRAEFTHLRSAYGGSDTTPMDAFEIESGTIPTLKLYDRAGRLRYTFGDGEPVDHTEIEVAVRQLLDE